jgi:hypothetical protein
MLPLGQARQEGALELGYETSSTNFRDRLAPSTKVQKIWFIQMPSSPSKGQKICPQDRGKVGHVAWEPC